MAQFAIPQFKVPTIRWDNGIKFGSRKATSRDVVPGPEFASPMGLAKTGSLLGRSAGGSDDALRAFRQFQKTGKAPRTEVGTPAAATVRHTLDQPAVAAGPKPKTLTNQAAQPAVPSFWKTPAGQTTVRTGVITGSATVLGTGAVLALPRVGSGLSSAGQGAGDLIEKPLEGAGEGLSGLLLGFGEGLAGLFAGAGVGAGAGVAASAEGVASAAKSIGWVVLFGAAGYLGFQALNKKR